MSRSVELRHRVLQQGLHVLERCERHYLMIRYFSETIYSRLNIVY